MVNSKPILTEYFINITDCEKESGVSYIAYADFMDPDPTKGIGSFFVKALTVAEGALQDRVINLESNETIYQVFQYTGTSQTGTVTVPTEATIFDLYGDSVSDAIVVKADINQKPLEEVVKTSSGDTVFISSFNNSGDYTLTGTPSEGACIIYFVKISDQYKDNIPDNTIIEVVGKDLTIYVEKEVGKGLVDLPKTVMTFNNMTYITGTTPMPETLAEWNTFYSTTMFTELIVSGNTVTLYGYGTDTLANNIFQNNTNITYWETSSFTTFGNACFNGCTGLTSVKICDTVTYIGEAAFSGCTNIVNLCLSNVLTHIGGVGFQGCNGLTSVTLPDSLEYLGGDAFVGCQGLITVNIGKNLTFMGHGAFYNCTSITTVVSESLVLGDTLGNDSVFAACYALQSITVPRFLESCNNGQPDGDLIEMKLANPSLVINYVGDEHFAYTRSTFATLEGNGVISGMGLSINADTTKFNIASGTYHVIGKGNIYYAGQSGITVPTITTANSTYIGLSTIGIVVQQLTKFTPTQRRAIIPLGLLIHSNKTNINAINNLPEVAKNLHSQFYDLLCNLKSFNGSGNVFSANGDNMFVNKSGGTLWKKGVNFENDNQNPHLKSLSALTAPTNLRYRDSSGVETSDTQSILTLYEVGGILQSIPNSKFAIQRVYLFPTNLVRIQPGKELYNSQSLAQQGITSEVFEAESNIAQNGLLRAYLIIEGGATSIIDSGLFIESDRWGEIPIGGAGGTTNLQQAYLNSPTPEIETTQGAVTLKNGGVSDNENVLEVQNLAGENKAEVKGNGTARFGDVLGGNYTEIEPDGTIVGKGSATTFRDELNDALSIQQTGPGVSKNLTEGTLDFTTAADLNDYGIVNVQFNHDRLINSKVYPHIHWFQSSVGSPNWLIRYRLQNTNTLKTTAWTNYRCNENVFTYTSGVLNQISHGFPNDVGILINGSVSDILQVRVIRDVANASGVFVGTDPFVGIGQLLSFDIHVECDTLGSRGIYSK
jgi:hypothetical protein